MAKYSCRRCHRDDFTLDAVKMLQMMLPKPFVRLGFLCRECLAELDEKGRIHNSGEQETE